jgi:DNA-binding transcriptional ArsR family regulator
MSTDRLSATFAALADPTRRAILAHLTKGEASVTELAKPFDMSLPAISKHLKVLERAGLIVRGREAQWRPASSTQRHSRTLITGLNNIANLGGKLRSLDDYLHELQTQEKQDGQQE